MLKNDDISVVMAGEAGQGVETASDIMVKVFKMAGYNVFSCKEYMSRVRGGVNSSTIRISSGAISAYVDKIDFLVMLSPNLTGHLEKRITEETFILYDEAFKNLSLDKFKTFGMPLTSKAVEVGGKIFSNVISAGIIFGIFDIAMNLIEEFIRKSFSDKTEDIILKNIQAVQSGYEIGKYFINNNCLSVNVQQDELVADKTLVSANEAVTLGCIAGGCDFIATYPMSPSTAVFTYLAEKSDEFNIIVEQAEDEIAAMNMGLGAWFSGSRAMVSTAGGGFALMIEGISLSGMIESPMVIHLAQRPGPATGLPTRTEQGDLNLALYSGHGEFPRIILTPGTPEDAFYLSQNAFNLADKFQVPIFILTDQYGLESYSLCKPFDVNKTEIQDFIVKTDRNYERYKLTEDGVSPRGIPDFGEGLVKVDSDEHDEDSHITEDLDLRVKMVDKRLKKFDLIKKEIYEPVLFGNASCKTLLIGWGSTCDGIKEALCHLNNPDIAFLYFKQVYPLSEKTLAYLEKAKNTICIENNATGQFAKLIRHETGFNIHHKILKYNGLPFSVEELVSKISDLT
ncbi:MAG TPA: 2-oxoacid:acceptor oxidoreductase subunit alpha [Cyanobacteria bacterium UBA9971]|nr:2-oxoacid:acceptor oxidoreductase subunit alpha [Cyanobacteria bacterium UBA9971]